MTCWADANGTRRLAVLVALAVAGGLQAQAVLPPTAPTSVSQLPSANPTVHRLPAHLAVLWNGVALQVEANNVSLNAVLHEIGRKTGMKVTGSAPDERVFGSYGPGPMNLVVPALLNGVAVNLLLTERRGGAADELVLTDRNGAATPSYIPTQEDAAGGTVPAAAQYGGRTQAVGASRGMVGRRYGAGNLPPNSTDPVIPDNGVSGRDNGINGRDNGQNGPDNGIAGRDNGVSGIDNGLNNSNAAANDAATSDSVPTTDGNTTASPNGVRTPQEIFNQLQLLRQQQTQTPQ